jgi:peroxiredoxin
LAQLRQAQGRFEQAKTQIVVVGMGNPVEAQQFKKEMSLKFPMLCDSGTQSYTAANLGQIQVKEELKPRNILALLRELFRGNRGGKIVGKVRQLGGAIIVDTGGVVRYSYRSRSASDNAEVKTLFKVVENL